MTVPVDQNAGDRWDATFDAAREFIRHRYEEDGCVVGIGEVLDHLNERFGAGAGIANDVTTVLNLCSALWQDPHIDRVPGEWIDFCWNEAGDWPRQASGTLHARLAARYQGGELG